VALVPPALTTVTSAVPRLPAGAVAEIVVALVTVKVAEVEPNLTEVAPVKPVPVIVTAVPPAGTPATGLTEDTVGIDV
jgi:hypothetical protein